MSKHSRLLPSLAGHALSLVLLGLFVVASAQASSIIRREWQVDGVMREALVYSPPLSGKTNPAPVVFVFHGHNGLMRDMVKLFHIETLWPEAIVVYMQGLNTPGHLNDFTGKQPGWQRLAGDQKDRDLKFFDAVLATLKKDFLVDSKRIYATGHSNGGAFTYLLWEERGNEFAAFAPSGAGSISLFGASENREAFLRSLSEGDKKRLEHILAITPDSSSKYIPRPVLHIAGKNDPLVKFAWQKPTIEAVKKLDECAGGATWTKDHRCVIYKSKLGTDVLTYIHSAKHSVPAEMPEIIVEFFKEYSRGAQPDEARTH